MSLLNNLLSSIDPSATTKAPAPAIRQAPIANVPKQVQRPASGANGAAQPQTLKRKADSPPENGQVKVQRKDGPSPAARPNGSVRPVSLPDSTKGKVAAPVAPSAPYRGTAGNGGQGATKPANVLAKRPTPINTSTPGSASKAPVPQPKASTPTPTSSAAAASAKKGSYAAMLQRAKAAQQSKPPTPPVKHEPTKILTKKERLALRAEAAASAKGKKAGAVPQAIPGKAGSVKAVATDKRKPTESGYQGTARPAKKPVEIGYKGTARPSTTPTGITGKATAPGAAKAKAKPSQGRYGGYASWSDEDMMEEEEEEDYDSDGSSDMEGGIWDVEQEEQLALKVAKKEDAEALAEENELKRQKEERKRKLMAMNKAAAGKRRY